MNSTRIILFDQSIELELGIDVISININPRNKDLYHVFKRYLDWNSIDSVKYYSKKEWQ